MSVLTAIPVYNEEKYLEKVLGEVRRYSREILVVNDGSTDRTAELMTRQKDIRVVTHPENRGYGAALISAFSYALEQNFETLLTMDCDGQHEPARIPVLLEALHDVDIVSGSRYLRTFRQDSPPPHDRMEINRQITSELNERFGLNLTDAFWLQSVPERRAGQASDYGNWLGNAFAALGASGLPGAAHEGDRRAARLPRSKSRVRRRPQRCHGPDRLLSQDHRRRRTGREELGPAG